MVHPYRATETFYPLFRGRSGKICAVTAAATMVTVTAQVVAAKRNDTALEQIVNHLSFEHNVSAATWQIDRSIPEE